MLFTFLAAVAACRCSGLRPGLSHGVPGGRGLVASARPALGSSPSDASLAALRDVGGAVDRASEDAAEIGCPEYLSSPPSTAKAPACFITQSGQHKGIGHQLFGTLSMMATQGLVGDWGICYVYNAAPRSFSFGYLEQDSEAFREAADLMTALYQDFRSDFSSSGCASAELVARSPEARVPMCQEPLLLDEIACREDSTWELDNVWYGSSPESVKQGQILFLTDFMQAVIVNATQLAALAARHLPPPGTTPSLAIHMRFGDRKDDLQPVALGQSVLLADSALAQFSPVHVFTDNVSEAELLLYDTAFADADIFGPDSATVVQAMARMVAADAFVGSRSDLSSSAALMRVGLRKSHTFMPSAWQWAGGYTDEQLTLYPEAELADVYPDIAQMAGAGE